jgi:type IV pilus assembly protein PilV
MKVQQAENREQRIGYMRHQESGLRISCSDNGFSLVEVMIAMVVLLVGMLGVMGMQYYSIGGNASSRELRVATSLSQEMIEQLRGTPYANLVTVATGTDNPLDIDADDAPTVTATSGGVNYTRSWWIVAGCTELADNGIMCIPGGGATPACNTIPDGAVASPASAIRARTCWTDRDGVDHSVTLDSVRWDETRVP